VTCLSDKNNWEDLFANIQERACIDTLLSKDGKAKVLKAKILKCLNRASDQGILNIKPHEIHDLLKISVPDKELIELIQVSGKSKTSKAEYYAITGGEKNQHRTQDKQHFKLHNGCWFDFTILIEENNKSCQVIGFNFEIRFPENSSNSYLRFDLNPPNHKNNEQNMRFHLHPSHDRIMVYSPPMSPLEILHIFLYGVSIRDKSRAS
jgi:hypothetical protein